VRWLQIKHLHLQRGKFFASPRAQGKLFRKSPKTCKIRLQMEALHPDWSPGGVSCAHQGASFFKRIANIAVIQRFQCFSLDVLGAACISRFPKDRNYLNNIPRKCFVKAPS